MPLDDRAADRQAHPHPTGFGRVECVEDPIQALRLQARTGISDRDKHGTRTVLLGFDQQLSCGLA